jgi:hypothetical protein
MERAYRYRFYGGQQLPSVAPLFVQMGIVLRHEFFWCPFGLPKKMEGLPIEHYFLTSQKYGHIILNINSNIKLNIINIKYISYI